MKEPVNVIKSIYDERSYRSITLDNGLKVLLVSHAEAEKSAACLDVKVGSMADPAVGQGLFHALEVCTILSLLLLNLR